MSVTMRHVSRSGFGTSIPVFSPLYSSGCDSWQLDAEGEVLCGRSELCQVLVPVDGIQERHCSFNLRGGNLTVRRLDGRVWVNDLPVSRESALVAGDILCIGPVSFQIESVAGPVAASTAQVMRVDAPVPASPTSPVLRSEAETPAITLQTPPLQAIAPPANPLQTVATLGGASVAESSLSQAERHQLNQRLQEAAEASAAAAARILEAEQREADILRRENQIQEMVRLAAERERVLAERNRALDERAGFLNDQKRSFEAQQSSLVSVKSGLQKQKEDLDRRLAQFAERESQLVSQLEESAAAYAQIEQTRCQLDARMENLSTQEEQLKRQIGSLDEAKKRQSEDASENARRVAELEERETKLQISLQQLREKEAAAAVAEAQLQLAHLASAEVSAAQAALHAEQQVLADQRSHLENSWKEVEARNEQLARQSEELASREQQAIEDSERRLAKAEAEYRNAQLRITDAESSSSELKEQSLRLAEQQAELERLKGELDSQRQELARRHEELASREVLVSEANNSRLLEIEDKLRQTLELESRLQAQAAELSQAFELRDRAAQELQELRSELQSRQDAIEAQTILLNQRAQEMETQAAELNAIRQEIQENAGSSTRSVGQLAAIAAEREAAIRARQEAHALQEEVRLSRAAVDQEQNRLSAWEAEVFARSEEVAARALELEHRSAELESRLSDIKALRDTAKLNSESAARTVAETELRNAELLSEKELLSKQKLELAEAEARLASLERAAQVALRNAEVERDALQSSHKDLLCERNSLVQMSQDLNSRSSALAEREALLVHQTDDLRSRFIALTNQEGDLQRVEAELNSRAAELHRRVTLFREESRAFEAERETSRALRAAGSEGGDLSDSSVSIDAEVARLTDAIATAESERDAASAERDALMMAVRELQRTMLEARSDVEEASRIRNEAANQGQMIDSLYKTIEDRSGQLQLMESKLRQAEENVQRLEAMLANVEPGMPSSGSAPERTSDDSLDCDEADLLAQLNALRSDLKQGQSSGSDLHEELQRSVAERDSLISELKQKVADLEQKSSLSEATTDADSAVSMVEVDGLRQQIADAQQTVQERDDLIRELRARLIQQSQQTTNVAAEIPDAAELQNEARELDRRANLLDDREEELRERIRKITQSEEEVETQRRQLLDARQQLEIARAEIQVAMKQHSAIAADSDQRATAPRSARETASFSGSSGLISELGGGLLTQQEPAHEEAQDASHDLRAELANLFGLKKSAPEPTPASEMPPRSAEQFLDLSDSAGDGQAVALRFGNDSSEIMLNPPSQSSAEESSEPAREENSDDFVRDYMEQLLSRSRKSAGNSLPSELKQQGGKSQPGGPQPKKSEQGKPAPRVTSFIDQYMAGGFGEPEGSGSTSATSSAPGSASADDSSKNAEPIIPRVKVDRQKLRENMDSFRSVSTMSVENALVKHAVNQQRSNINGRIVVTVVLIGMSAFLAIANQKGVINHPWLVWVTLVSALGAAAELLRKWYAVKGRCKLATVPEGNDPSMKKTGLHSHAAFGVSASNGVSPEAMPPMTGGRTFPDYPNGHRPIDARPDSPPPLPESNPAEYFEL